MMERQFELFDVVVIRDGIPDHGVLPGAEGTVVDFHTKPRFAYEVEVIEDESGEVIWIGGIEPEKLESPRKDLDE